MTTDLTVYVCGCEGGGPGHQPRHRSLALDFIKANSYGGVCGGCSQPVLAIDIDVMKEKLEKVEALVQQWRDEADAMPLTHQSNIAELLYKANELAATLEDHQPALDSPPAG